MSNSRVVERCPPPYFGREGTGNYPESAHRIAVTAGNGDLKANVRGGRYWISGGKEKILG